MRNYETRTPVPIPANPTVHFTSVDANANTLSTNSDINSDTNTDTDTISTNAMGVRASLLTESKVCEVWVTFVCFFF